MNFFRKITDKTSPKKDLSIIINYIKAGFKIELDIARLYQKIGIKINFNNDDILNSAAVLASNVIKDFDEILRHTDLWKRTTRSDNKKLSPDENYAIGMVSIKDIKKAGLNRSLTRDEQRLIKTATVRFNDIYSEQIKISRQKNKLI